MTSKKHKRKVKVRKSARRKHEVTKGKGRPNREKSVQGRKMRNEWVSEGVVEICWLVGCEWVGE